MNQENSYQNQDLDNLNPLHTPEDDIVDKSKKTSDPKIKLLKILGAVVVVLLILSLFVTKNRGTKAPIRVSPTPSPNITPQPTEIVDTQLIPTDLKAKFDSVNLKIQTDVNFNPPQIDPDVGL